MWMNINFVNFAPFRQPYFKCTQPWLFWGGQTLQTENMYWWIVVDKTLTLSPWLSRWTTRKWTTPKKYYFEWVLLKELLLHAYLVSTLFTFICIRLSLLFYNRPFPSSPQSLFQSEAKCEVVVLGPVPERCNNSIPGINVPYAIGK